MEKTQRKISIPDWCLLGYEAYGLKARRKMRRKRQNIVKKLEIRLKGLFGVLA